MRTYTLTYSLNGVTHTATVQADTRDQAQRALTTELNREYDSEEYSVVSVQLAR